jgi:hypothetical protein
MITYTWNFDPLTCYTHKDGYEDVVMIVHWQLTATSGSTPGAYYSTRTIGTQTFTFDPESDTFIPFNELTKEIVQSWVTTALGEESVNQMMASLETQIEDQVTPKIINLSPPWNQSPVEQSEE